MTPYQEIKSMRTHQDVLDGKISIIDKINLRIRQLEYKRDDIKQNITDTTNSIDAKELMIKKLRNHRQEEMSEYTKINNDIKNFEKFLHKEKDRIAFVENKLKETRFINNHNKKVLCTHRIKDMKIWYINDAWMFKGDKYIVMKVKITEDMFEGNIQEVYVTREEYL